MAKKNKNQQPVKTKPNFQDTSTSTTVQVDYFHLMESLYAHEINDWLEARAARYNPFYPTTYQLQQLYKDSMLDNHLSGAIDTQRVLPILNKAFIIRDTQEKTDNDLSKLIQGKWFRDIVREAMMSIFYGYSLIFLDSLPDPAHRQIISIHRENVIPERGIIVRNPMDTSGEHITYTDFPSYFVFASLGSNKIGLLESIAPLTIYKRHSWASWDEFEQIFGLPIRIARTAINTQKHHDDLQQWLETMGAASYAIFDKNTDIELHESQHKDAYHIYLEKVKAVNSEISKRVLGQTMTTEDGSSQSQAEVHLKILETVQLADVAELTDWLNDTLLPVLRLQGFNIPDGYTIAVVDKPNVKPKDKIAIDQVLLNAGYNLDPDYIEDFYGTPLVKDQPRREPSTLSLSAEDFFA